MSRQQFSLAGVLISESLLAHLKVKARSKSFEGRSLIIWKLSLSQGRSQDHLRSNSGQIQIKHRSSFGLVEQK